MNKQNPALLVSTTNNQAKGWVDHFNTFLPLLLVLIVFYAILNAKKFPTEIVVAQTNSLLESLRRQTTNTHT